MTKRISVIIPTYQHAETIPATLEGVFAQNRQPDEVIVVNDGSTDQTKEAVQPFLDHITYIEQENAGGNPARNRGFEASTGDYVIFLDADILMAPDMLEKMERELEAHPEASYVYSGFRFGWKGFKSFPFDDERLRTMNFIHTSSLLRREHFPGFDPAIKRLQDWDVWLSMLEDGRLGFFIDKELFYVQEALHRIGISQWRPSFMYKIPWNRIGWMPKSMKNYYDARDILRKKHGL